MLPSSPVTRVGRVKLGLPALSEHVGLSLLVGFGISSGPGLARLLKHGAVDVQVGKSGAESGNINRFAVGVGEEGVRSSDSFVLDMSGGELSLSCKLDSIDLFSAFTLVGIRFAFLGGVTLLLTCVIRVGLDDMVETEGTTLWSTSEKD